MMKMPTLLRACLRPAKAVMQRAVERTVDALIDENRINTIVDERYNAIIAAKQERLEQTRQNLPLVRPIQPRFYAYLTPDSALAQLFDGHFVFVDPVDNEMALQLIANGFWKMWADRIIRQLVGPGYRVIDVGANYGYYTLIMASLVGPTGHLDSFEANPRLARLLARSVEFNGYAPWTTVRCAAAGNKVGTAQLSAWRHKSASDEESMKIGVPMLRLDDVVGEEAVDLIRIDAEGSEPLILDGARQILLRSPKVMICMEWSVAMMSERVNVDEFIRDVRGLGFRIWKIEHDSSFAEMTDDQMKAVEICNVMVSRNDPRA
jgi:FkbM family methyltransferase